MSSLSSTTNSSSALGVENSPLVANAQAMSVSELTQRIKNQLEMSYPSVSVQGEISNFKRHSSGHLYFSLKDEGAQIQAVLFQPSASKLVFEPRDGDRVVLGAGLSVYNQRGQYQLIVRHMEKVGLGEILLKLEALKKELKALGWFDPSSKKAIPKFPDRLGVISSPTGAVIRDILHVLRLRHPGFNLTLYPAKVQGAGSAQEIVEGIRLFNQHKLCDVIILARGGGSFEDLMPFNERILLQAVHDSEIPIISAVGHETDFTLCDFVASLRAPTPSAAAERVLPAKTALQDQLNYLRQTLSRHIQTGLRNNQMRLQAIIRSSFIANPHTLVQPGAQRLDDLNYKIDSLLKARVQHVKSQCEKYAHQVSPVSLHSLIQKARHQILNSQQQLGHSLEHLHLQSSHAIQQNWQNIHTRLEAYVGREHLHLEHICSHLLPSRLLRHVEENRKILASAHETLQALSPESALRRGYAILRLEKNHRLAQAKELCAGDLIEIDTYDARLWSLVQRIEFKSPRK